MLASNHLLPKYKLNDTGIFNILSNLTPAIVSHAPTDA